MSKCGSSVAASQWFRRARTTPALSPYIRRRRPLRKLALRRWLLARRRGTPAAAKQPAPEEGLHIVRSPIVGTFYESPSPGSPPFVKPGDMVEAGQILCIVEAMKLMNEIESDVAGEIVKRLVENNAPIEYGQELFAIRARS